MKAKDFRLVIRYMANVWCEGVCLSLYGEVMGEHFWDKWCSYKNADLGTMGLFYSMDTEYLQILIDAALKHYGHLRD